MHNSLKDEGKTVLACAPTAILAALDRKPSFKSEVEKPFAVGEEIRFTQNNEKLAIFNCQKALIQKIDERGMTVALGDNRQKTRFLGYKIKNFFGLEDNPARILKVNFSEYNSFDYAYAATIHKAQGGTWKQAVVALTNNMIDKNGLYVAMSRHQKECTLFVSKHPYRNKTLRAEEKELNKVKSRWFLSLQDCEKMSALDASIEDRLSRFVSEKSLPKSR